ncbi:MAG: hypothetical protein ACKVS9_08560, partial [Phycisphaerae bacterium]
FPYMFRNVSHITHNAITRRLQVATGDLDPAQNAGAQYVFEAQYVSPDDAAARNQDNNASYRTATITGNATNANATLTGSTQRQRSAIQHWRGIDPQVVETSFESREAANPNGGDNAAKSILAARATEVQPGEWHYEYALYNMNSDRGFAGVSVPLAASLPATDIGFRDVPYHSGDGHNSAPGNVVNFDGTDWPGTKTDDAIAWSLVPATPIENSNALRWATMYNFRFRTTVGPVSGNVRLTHFKSVAGLDDTTEVQTIVPGNPPPLCRADLDGDSDIDLTDLATLLSSFGAPGGVTFAAGDVDSDGDVDLIDLATLLTDFGAPCP